MHAAAALLRQATAEGEHLMLGRERLTAESLRAALRDACRRQGAPAPPDVMVDLRLARVRARPRLGPPARQPADPDRPLAVRRGIRLLGGHDPDIRGRRGERGRSSAGGLVRQALESARAAVRPGVRGRELHDLTCDLFEAAGFRTQRTGPADHDPDEGFQFSLGHGVGLRVHEDPGLGRGGDARLVAGE